MCTGSFCYGLTRSMCRDICSPMKWLGSINLLLIGQLSPISPTKLLQSVRSACDNQRGGLTRLLIQLRSYFVLIEDLIIRMNPRHPRELRNKLKSHPPSRGFVAWAKNIADTPILRRAARNLPANSTQCLLAIVDEVGTFTVEHDNPSVYPQISLLSLSRYLCSLLAQFKTEK